MNAYGHQPTTMHTAAPLPGIWGWLLNTASLYGEVLLRSRFGERHLTLMGVLLGMAGLMFLPIVAVVVFTFLLSSFLLGSMGGLFVAAFSTQLPWARGTIFFHLFTLAFLARCCWHFIQMEYSRRGGEQVVSTYSGRPSVLWRLVPGLGQNEGLIKRFAEPAVMILLALWVRQTDFLLTIYLAVSGVAMFVKGHFEAWLINQRLHNLHDQMLESQALGGHVRSRSNQPGDMKGVATPAALDGYVPHQARALTSTLQAQSPLAPLSPGLPHFPQPDFSAGLAPEYARLLSHPIPVEEPVEDWFVEEAPIVEDWFLPIPAAEQSAANPATGCCTDSRVLIECPACKKTLLLPPGKDGKWQCCGNCQQRILINDELKRAPIPPRRGAKHAA